MFLGVSRLREFYKTAHSLMYCFVVVLDILPRHSVNLDDIFVCQRCCWLIRPEYIHDPLLLY
jgi:hypothetical protein